MRIDVLVMSIFSAALLFASAFLAIETASFKSELWPVYLYGSVIMASLAVVIANAAATLLRQTSPAR